ncbi:MAG: T9SS type A sorting domain-containing protein [Bacteroidetes bacterium]|nr:T9SS type A sorting domain-containing protein [Bacteroidota bacterium]
MKNQLSILVIILIQINCFSQAPNISYQTPQNYVVGAAITPLSPSNTGGAIPAIGYGQVTTFAGTGLQGSADGAANTASFRYPAGIGLDSDGNVYVSEQGNVKVRKITPAGIVSTLAGNGTTGFANGMGSNASFNNLIGLTVDASGNVYVSDSYNYRIRKIDPLGMVSTYAGSGLQGVFNGNSANAGFYGAAGLACDASGNVYVSEYGSMKIRKITPSGMVSTLAGNGSAAATDGPGAAASFNNPWGMAVDANGNLYVADISNQKIRKITPSGEVSTFAGSGSLASTDGTGTLASFYLPYGLAFDSTGNLYVSEAYKIRKITPSGVVTTLVELAGSPDGSQNALAYDPSGYLYLTGFSQKIFKIALTGYSITPNLPAGLSFDATTGVISGNPLVDSPATTYTISAYNNSGQSTATIVISTSTLGTSTPQLKKLTLYPNPTTSVLHFEQPDNEIFKKIVLTDLAGKKVIEEDGNADQMNVEQLAPGCYIVKVMSQDNVYVNKFTKE